MDAFPDWSDYPTPPVDWGSQVLLAVCLVLILLLVVALVSRQRGARRRMRDRRRRQQELARVRMGETELAFARLFPARQAEAARTVYRYLTARLAVVRDLPLHPEDSLAELFGVYTPDGPAIEAVVRELCGRLHVGSAYLPVELPSPRTVGELVHAAAGFAERPARLSLLRAADAPASAEGLLRPASGSAAEAEALLRAAPGEPE